MAILVINPNATTSMTAQLARQSQRLLHTEHEILFETCTAAPASIEGYSDGVAAGFHLLQLVRRYEADASKAIEAYVIACFDDTALHAVRELTTKPVLGIGESAMHAATMLSHRFCIMTTLQRSVPIIERNLADYGFYASCAGVFASNIPVLQLETDPSAYQRILQSARQLLQTHHGEALVLGCAGMSHWVERMTDDLAMPVIDGLRVALKFSAALADLNLQTSKVCAYRYPEKK